MRMKTKKISDRSAVCYVRVSTKKQSDQGYSPESQRAAIEAYARAQGLDIKRWFEETKSSFNNLQARTAYYAMLVFIEENKISNVIYKFADRIARNLPDFIKLEELGVHLHNLERGHSFNPNEHADYQATAEERGALLRRRKSQAGPGRRSRTRSRRW
jgi:hypothetical protein